MSTLPEELLLSLNDRIPCRELQIRQLATLLFISSPSTIVVHGVEATGKSLIIQAVLEAVEIPSAVIRSRECITTRHLLERTLSSVQDALRKHGVEEVDTGDGRCESISAFLVQLQQLLDGKGRFILVFDGIDRQREAAPTLLPAIARLGELVRLLVFISKHQANKHPDPKSQHNPHNNHPLSSPPPPLPHPPHPLPTLHPRRDPLHPLPHPPLNLPLPILLHRRNRLPNQRLRLSLALDPLHSRSMGLPRPKLRPRPPQLPPRLHAPLATLHPTDPGQPLRRSRTLKTNGSEPQPLPERGSAHRKHCAHLHKLRRYHETRQM